MSRARSAFSSQELTSAAKAAAATNTRAEWESLPDGTKRVSFTPLALVAAAQGGAIPDAAIAERKW